MEDEDCSVNDQGQIDVKYQGWTEINSTIYSYHENVINLDLSFNRLQSLPEEISSLRRLKFLNCENNEIETLPQSLGKLRALRKVKFSRNKITTLPESIGNCLRLTKLSLDNNVIESLPRSLGNCISLEHLSLSNNNLLDLPLSLATLNTCLKHVDVTNNPNLAIIPDKIKGDTEAIMWILTYRYDRTMELRVIRQATIDMGKVMKKNRDEIEGFKQEIKALKIQKKELETERESFFMYLRFREFRMRLRYRLQLIIRQAKDLFDTGGSKVVVE